MSFRKVLLYDEEDKNISTQTEDIEKASEETQTEKIDKQNIDTQTVNNQIVLPEKVFNKNENVSIDENFYKFIEDIVKRVFEKSFNKKSKKSKKTNGKTGKQVIDKKKNIKAKKKTVKNPVYHENINWIY